jgi:hypothetical protein
MALASSLDIGVVGKMRPVDSRLGVSCNRVCYQISQASMNDKDGRVWTEKQVGIGAIRLEGGFGPDDDS